MKWGRAFWLAATLLMCLVGGTFLAGLATLVWPLLGSHFLVIAAFAGLASWLPLVTRSVVGPPASPAVGDRRGPRRKGP